MKKYIIVLVLSGLIFCYLNSCKKEIIENNSNYPAINPSRLDTNAGNWKLILLNSPTDILCPAPIPTSNPDYRLQVNEVLSFQHAQLNSSQKKKIEFWGAGATLRWNELMRELVAKHNLPPVANADGSYPFPSSNNPFAYPQFPFANPPYAARAYAYLSAAQYDAVVVAYYYKKLYSRLAPYNYDDKVISLLPKNTISSYPSEDAAILGVSAEILKLLFPGDQDLIDKKVQEHIIARISSGANVRSDIDAGLSIGKAVAAKFMPRARTDNAGSAAGNASIWAQLEANAKVKGEIPWLSLESPPRPPMLPLFGNVKGWLIDSAILTNGILPGPPPSTNSQQFKDELAEIKKITQNLTRSEMAIAHFWADGVGTYTPPGHWNYIAADAFSKQNYSEARWARNYALLNMALMDAAITCWKVKYLYCNPRPSQIDNTIKSVTGVPNFPAYISGHSTFSGAASAVLGYLIPNMNSEFESMANEASKSRMYGGIHYRSDCETGLSVGKKIGNLAIQRGKTDGAQ